MEIDKRDRDHSRLLEYDASTTYKPERGRGRGRERGRERKKIGIKRERVRDQGLTIYKLHNMKINCSRLVKYQITKLCTINNIL